MLKFTALDFGQPLEDKTKSALPDAWHNHILLLFRDRDIPEDALLHSADWIGTLGIRHRRYEIKPKIFRLNSPQSVANLPM